ncbi:MAG: universal stress protein [Streptosporangiaceae bacterium]|jgi:nucleotide-binding universal stress UspA family protein
MPSPHLRQLCAEAARQRLRDALDMAFGGTPAGVRTGPLVCRGEPGRILVSVAREPDDLLVIGRGWRPLTGRLLHRGVSHYCLARASCPVLAVPPSALEQAAGHGLRGWAFRRRGLRPAQISSAARR